MFLWQLPFSPFSSLVSRLQPPPPLALHVCLLACQPHSFTEYVYIQSIWMCKKKRLTLFTSHRIKGGNELKSKITIALIYKHTNYIRKSITNNKTMMNTWKTRENTSIGIGLNWISFDWCDIYTSNWKNLDRTWNKASFSDGNSEWTENERNQMGISTTTHTHTHTLRENLKDEAVANDLIEEKWATLYCGSFLHPKNRMEQTN